MAPAQGKMITNLKRSVPNLGNIKIGRKGDEKTSKRGNKFQAPEKLDFFVITTNDRDTAGNFIVDKPLMTYLANRQEARTGTQLATDDKTGCKKVTRIPIVVLSDEITDFFRSEYSKYDGKKKTASCDGETLTQFWYGGKKLPVPMGQECEGEHEKEGWKPHGTFSCVINGGEDGSRFGGVHRFRTTSMISIEQLMGSVDLLTQMTGGMLAHMPLELCLRPVKVRDGTSTVHVVHLELVTEDLRSANQYALEMSAMRNVNRPQLIAAAKASEVLMSTPETEEEQADIAEEFHPETAATESEPDEPEPNRTRAKPTAVKTATVVVDSDDIANTYLESLAETNAENLPVWFKAFRADFNDKKIPTAAYRVISKAYDARKVELAGDPEQPSDDGPACQHCGMTRGRHEDNCKDAIPF